MKPGTKLKSAETHLLEVTYLAGKIRLALGKILKGNPGSILILGEATGKALSQILINEALREAERCRYRCNLPGIGAKVEPRRRNRAGTGTCP